MTSNSPRTSYNKHSIMNNQKASNDNIFLNNFTEFHNEMRLKQEHFYNSITMLLEDFKKEQQKSFDDFLNHLDLISKNNHIIRTNDAPVQASVDLHASSIIQDMETVKQQSLRAEPMIQSTNESQDSLKTQLSLSEMENWSQISESTCDSSIVKVKNTTTPSWQKDCLELINKLLKINCTKAFRYPVDESIYKDYRIKIKTPMDLSTIKEHLETQYSFSEFKKDMELIFENSRTYTPDSNTQIYKDTVKFEKVYRKYLEPLNDKYNKKSPTKRKNIINSSDDSDTDRPTTSSAKKIKSNKPEFIKRRTRSSNKNNGKCFQNNTEEDDNTTCSNQSSEEYDDSFIDDSNNLSDESEIENDINIPLTSKEDLFKYQINDLKDLTGEVKDVIYKKKVFVKWKGEYSQVLQVTINNNEGDKVDLCAWGEDAITLKEKIKKKDILLIEKGIVKPTNEHNAGNMPYIIGIKSYTKITDKKTDERLI